MGAAHGNAGVRTRIAAEIVAIFHACCVGGVRRREFQPDRLAHARRGACEHRCLFFASYEASRPRLRDIMPTVVLAALCRSGAAFCSRPFPISSR